MKEFSQLIKLKCQLLITLFILLIHATALAVDDDASKFEMESDKNKKLQNLQRDQKILDKTPTKQNIPEAAKNFKFFLKKIKVIGATALHSRVIADTYLRYLNKEVTLSLIYEIAAEITNLYIKQGYFLSLAYVPEQKINENQGEVIIKIIEGYIHNIKLPKETATYNPKILRYIENVIGLKPITIKELVSTLLRLNDLFGYQFTSTLANLNTEQQPGGIRLVVSAAKKKNDHRIVINNYSSESTGPHKAKLLYTQDLSPFNQIRLFGENNIIGNMKKFNYFNIGDNIVINKYIDLNFSGEFTRINTTSTVNAEAMQSRSNNFSAILNYKLIRQRENNLYLKWIFNARNSGSYLLNNQLSDDKIRTFKFGLSYDFIIGNTYNLFDINFIRGLGMLNASKKGDRNLSRANADPNFNKIELNFTHLLKLINNFSLLLNIYGQYVNKVMFSAEEFSFGGQTIGRAFNSSEISGDHGLSGILELNYNDLVIFRSGKVIPYIYYDLGTVWRKDPNRLARDTGSSSGFGFRANILNFNTHLGLAWPINRDISNPIYGRKPRSPRISVEFSLNW